ncbi:MAG: hypothetical protein O0V67_00570 [Methanocorpusculum sp.]|nr:hypothetical protein [Methanocorpusculum sp.]
MDTVQANIEKSARIADIAIKIVWILLWLIIVLLAGVFFLTILIYCAEGPDGFSVFVTTENVLEVFGSMTLPEGVSPFEMFLRAAAVFCASTISYLVLLAAMLRSMGKIFSEIRQTLLPFTTANAQRMKKASIYMALLSVVPCLIGVAGNAVVNVPVDPLPLSLELLLAAAVLYCLAHIFEYGVLLQQQADETL